MYSRILNCDYEFVSPWWDEVSLNAKDLVSSLNYCPDCFSVDVHALQMEFWMNSELKCLTLKT